MRHDLAAGRKSATSHNRDMSLTIVYRAAKEKALEEKLATPAEDESAGGGAFDALDEDDEFGGGGLMVS